MLLKKDKTANSREAENSSVKQKEDFWELFSYSAKCLPILMFSKEEMKDLLSKEQTT